jgi:hypothetical protein
MEEASIDVRMAVMRFIAPIQGAHSADVDLKRFGSDAKPHNSARAATRNTIVLLLPMMSPPDGCAPYRLSLAE